MDTNETTKPGAGAPIFPASGRQGQWRALVVIALATLMVTMDTAIVIVALPSAQKSLGMSDASRQWVVAAYTLAYGGLLLLGGRLADRLGHRRTLLIGVIGFVFASAMGGASVGGWMLIAARALQGAFGAILVPSTRSLLAIIFTEPRERARAMGIFTATLIAGVAVGFILSGLLTTYLSWRWSLYVNVPVAVIVGIGALALLPDLRGDPGVRIDVPSAILGSCGMAVLVYGLSEAASLGWSSVQVLSILVAALAMLGAFVGLQVRVSSPLLPLRVLADRNRAGSFMALALGSVGTFGMFLIVTYLLQTVVRYSALATGIAFIPFAVASTVSSAGIAPRLIPHVGPRYLVTPGIALSSAGLFMLSHLASGASMIPLMVGAEGLIGLGNGLTGTSALNLALTGIERADTGVTSAMSSTSNQFGASIGTALLSSLAASATSSYLASHPETAGLGMAAVYGYASATDCGGAILLVGALLVGVLVDARPGHGPLRKP